MTIAIRADANEATGTGHLSRCLALAEAFTGADLTLAYHQAPSPLLAHFVNLGVTLHHIQATPYGEEDAYECNSLGGDWIIVDGYLFKKSFFHSLEIKTAAIDDFARPEVFEAEVIINPGATAKADWYRDGQTTLLGPRFAPLRKEFQEASIPRIPNKVLLTTGGGDDLNITPSIIRELRDIANLTVIIGPANSHRDKLLKEFGAEVTLLENVCNMASELASSSLVICGAGSTVWECLAVGTPLIPMILADNQRANHDFLVERNLAPSGGDARRPDFLPTLRSSYLRVSNHTESALESAEKGKLLLDGHGSNRIFEQLKDFCHPTNS